MKAVVWIHIFMICQFSMAQYTNTEVVAKIKTNTIDDSVIIVGAAVNTTEVYKSLTYVLSVFKTDTNANVAKNTQEGRFTLESNENKELVNTAITIDEDSKIVLLLLIYEEDKIIAKDRIAFNEKKNEEIREQEETSNDGVALKGIVLDETKTKPGRDFYDYFYNTYILNQINGNKVVGVYEKLSFGRSTIIQIKIEDVVVHEFLGKPDQEYLDNMSKISIRKVYKYFKDLKKQKHAIFQY